MTAFVIILYLYTYEDEFIFSALTLLFG